MNSPKQSRPTSTPKPVTFAPGFKPQQPMATKRITPTAKTAACKCS